MMNLIVTIFDHKLHK